MRKPYVLIESGLLDGEVVVLAAPPATLPGSRVDHPGKVVYWHTEVQHLGQLLQGEQLDAAGEDLVRQVHLVKKALNAELVSVKVGESR